MLLAAGALLAACSDDNNDNSESGKTPSLPGGNYPPVQIDKATSGAVKAGKAGAIEIVGSGFDPEWDLVEIGFEDENGQMQYVEMSSQICQIKSTRITLGVRIDELFLDKTVRVYLSRIEYDTMPLTDEITFQMPTVDEGYIPDPTFRQFLSNNPHNCPAFAALFDDYGMMNPSAAASIKSCESKDGWTFDLAGCQAESLEGIEHFTGIQPRPGDERLIVAAWDMPNLKKIDLSKWQMKNYCFYVDRAKKLEEFVGSPYMHTVRFDGCASLKKVDLSACRGLVRCWIKNETNGDNLPVEELDLRRDQSGTYADSPSREGEFCYLQGDCNFRVADNCKIKIDSWFLGSHPIENSGQESCWVDIYNAWKRGASIEVYWWKDISRYLDTAPLYSADPDALSPGTMPEGTTEPVNKWKVTEPTE